MKSIRYLLCIAAFANATVLVVARPASAASSKRGVGLGVVFGEPTGITGKFWMGNRDAIDVGLSYSFQDYFLAYADKLWHFPGVIKNTKKTKWLNQLSPYAGIGGGLFAGIDTRFDARIPLGVEWLPKKPPIGAFLELVPALRLAPNVQGDVGGGIGARYYF